MLGRVRLANTLAIGEPECLQTPQWMFYEPFLLDSIRREQEAERPVGRGGPHVAHKPCSRTALDTLLLWKIRLRCVAFIYAVE